MTCFSALPHFFSIDFFAMFKTVHRNVCCPSGVDTCSLFSADATIFLSNATSGATRFLIKILLKLNYVEIRDSTRTNHTINS